MRPQKTETRPCSELDVSEGRVSTTAGCRSRWPRGVGESTTSRKSLSMPLHMTPIRVRVVLASRQTEIRHHCILRLVRRLERHSMRDCRAWSHSHRYVGTCSGRDTANCLLRVAACFDARVRRLPKSLKASRSSRRGKEKMASALTVWSFESISHDIFRDLSGCWICRDRRAQAKVRPG